MPAGQQYLSPPAGAQAVPLRKDVLLWRTGKSTGNDYWRMQKQPLVTATVAKKLSDSKKSVGL